MRRDQAAKRVQWLSILLAALIGFLLGNWHASKSHLADLSASQNVALRFPEAQPETPFADAASSITAGAMVLGDAQLALLSPKPMVPPPARQSALPMPAQTAAPDEPASPAPLDIAPARQPVPSTQSKAPKPTAANPERPEVKSAADGGVRHAARPGFLLNDVQIASIRTRLHLTPDQESMWPAVEAALRNVAYAKARKAHQRGAPSGSAEVASLDPDSAEVQGLKSAAIPLIMSFSDQQKSEVRSLAHVMGLDRLASEF